MLPGKDTLRDPLKGWTTSLPKAMLSFLLKLKAPLAFCAVVSISLIIYSVLPAAPPPSLRLRFHKPDPVSRLLSTNETSPRPPPPTNISHLMFGIGGAANTWTHRSQYSQLWWRPNVTRGYVWLDRNPNTSASPSSPPHRVSADTSRFKYTSSYGSRSAVRIARIVKESFELGLDGVRWFVMGDDDTVFFVENLVSVLAKYDHNQMYYVGGNSESVEQDVIHSYDMGYGGGGFAISYPLAKELVKVLDGCIDRYASFYGSDQKVQACMVEIGIPLTKELGFHQMDIRGSPYGLLAAHPVASLVSLHHVDYLRPIFPEMSQVKALRKLMDSYTVDPSRALQRSFCYDLRRNWTVSVSWGYTVQLYPSLVTAKRLDATIQTFKTWRTWKESPFMFNTRPVKGQNPGDVPVLYFLDQVRSRDNNNVGRFPETLTTYKKHVAGFGDEKVYNRSEYRGITAVQTVHVTSYTMDPKSWTLVSFSFTSFC
ncbi:hypothetical protein LINPERHAP2_LOCUS8691 [Linum perenne]